MKISFVIPAYNEEKTVGGVIETLKERYPDSEIVAVDDGSSDNTFREIQKADVVVKHDKNMGIGEAISSGIKRASGDFCVIVDADGQHPLSEIEKVVDRVKSSIDAVLTQRKSLLSSGIFKAIGKFILTLLVNFFTKQKFKDINSGLCALRRKKIVRYIQILPSRYSFSTATLILVNLLRFNVEYVEIEVEKRKAGRSKVRIRDFLTALFIILSMVVIFEPLNFFIPLSLYSFYVGVLSGLFSLLVKNVQNPLGFSHFFTFSVSMFIVGLISHQISIVIKKLFSGEKDES